MEFSRFGHTTRLRIHHYNSECKLKRYKSERNTNKICEYWLQVDDSSTQVSEQIKEAVSVPSLPETIEILNESEVFLAVHRLLI